MIGNLIAGIDIVVVAVVRVIVVVVGWWVGNRIIKGSVGPKNRPIAGEVDMLRGRSDFHHTSFIISMHAAVIVS